MTVGNGFLAEQFEKLAGASNGVAKLRELILQLAVQGKLVEQDPEDEAAEVLLERIDTLRSELLDNDYPNAAEARTQKKKQAKQRLPANLPRIPRSWAWTTLQQCSLMVIDCKNKTAPYSNAGIKLIRTTNVRDGKLNSNDQKFVSEETCAAWSARAQPEPGDVLITREAPMGEVCIIPEGERICLGQRMMLARLVPNTIDPRFLLYSLRDPDLMDRVQDKPLGMTVQHLRVGGVETLLVPLPPLPEQHRIVAKVNQLMALCDRLETHQTQAHNTRRRLNRSALDRLMSADDEEEFAHHWQLICDHFDLLYDDPENVGELRKAILQLAVQGKLVEQDPGDEPAEVLLERIACERANEKTASRRRAAGHSDLLATVDTRNLLPEGWKWARFVEVARIDSNLVKPSDYQNEPHIAPDCIEKGTGRLISFRTVAEDGVTSSKHRFFPGQILYSEIRPNLSKAITVDIGGLCSADMYPIHSWLDRNYLHRFFLSQEFIDQVTSEDNRLAMPKVNQQQLSGVAVPVPPLPEQHRIVAKVDQLMALCDRLEQNLRQASDQREKLASATVQKLAAA